MDMSYKSLEEAYEYENSRENFDEYAEDVYARGDVQYHENGNLFGFVSTWKSVAYKLSSKYFHKRIDFD